MVGARRKRQMKDKTARTLFCIAMYAVLAVFIVGLFVINSNYTKIYHSPQVTDGKVDFGGVDFHARDLGCNLNGEWEFFYNKWIVTDNEDCAPDGMIKMPSVWTYKDYGNGKLPRTGYASYRLYAENVQPGVEIKVYRYYSTNAYRVFINGEINYSSGTMSKTPGETRETGIVNEEDYRPYLTDGSPLEIVIEVSASNIGGFNAAPWLGMAAQSSYGLGLRSFSLIAFGIVTATVVISILLFALFRYNRDFTILGFMAALYAHFVTSKDMLYLFEFRTLGAMLAELISALAAFALLVVHFHRNGAQIKKAFYVPTAVAAGVFAALLVAFYGTPVAPWFAFLLFASICGYLVPFIFNRKFSTPQYIIYGILTTFLLSIFFLELCEWLGILVFGTDFYFSIELMLIIICFAVLWLLKLAKATRAAMRVSELESELSALQNKALKAQIKPHFVYNSLTAIQAQYRDGLSEGDKAIEQFASHLRLITDSNGDDLIPFDDEVRNVLNYFELENLRAGHSLELLLDLNFTDFSVPVLSLQPLVENAIRHGGLRDRRDGYITLSSDKTDSAIIISVSDNGKGFDVSVAYEGVGIANTKKRFALINANMTVESKPGLGTKITIEIPLE